MRKLLSLFSRFLFMDALFEGGRMFVGATSIAYLLKNNLSFADIALLKSTQAIVIIVGEIPTGVLADSVGRRFSLLLSVASGAVGFALFYLGSQVSTFLIAESLTAISICFWSGAFESLAIDTLELNQDRQKMHHFFHLNQAVNSIAVLVFGGFGGFLAVKGLEIPYLGALFSFFFLAAVVLTVRVKEPVLEKMANLNWVEKVRTHFKEILFSGLVNQAILPFVFANIGIQFIIQPLLHYWQPHFQGLDQTVNSQALGVIFSCYCGTSAVAGYLFSRLSFKQLLSSRHTPWVLFLVFSLIYIAFGFARGVAAALVTFCLLQGVLSVTRTALGIQMNHNIPNASRASILSSLSLVSRLGSVSALALVAGFGAPEHMMQFMSVTSFAIASGVLMTASLMKKASSKI